MYVKVPLGVIMWLSYFTLHISQKYWLFIHFPSCSHQVNCTHWTKWYFTDFPYLLLANQWRPKIWEGPTRRLWRWYVDLFSKKHFPILEKCAQLTLSPFSLLDTSLHCLVQACPAKIGRCKNWSRSANHPYGHPGNSQHFLNTLNMNSWHLKCQWDHQRWVHSSIALGA